MIAGDPVITATFNEQMALGAALSAGAVIIHGMGLFTLRRFILSEGHGVPVSKWTALSFRGAVFTVLIVFALLVLHMVQIWLFALFFDFVRALPDFREALYFSTISYATIGYSDEAIVREWRMVAALEGILGVIMLGWSTAFLMRVIGRLEGDGSSDGSGGGSGSGS